MLENVSDWATCANCGKAVRWSDSFCSACGARIEPTGSASVDLPLLSSSVEEAILWNRPVKKRAKAGIESVDLKFGTPLSKVAETDETLQGQVDENRFGSADISPKRSARLLAPVLAELLTFFPYAFIVLRVFKYNSVCAILAISSAVVLLTHGVCVLGSYLSIFIQRGDNWSAGKAKAVENTQRLLKRGAVFISAFLLAFFVCLYHETADDAKSDAAADFTPKSFDD